MRFLKVLLLSTALMFALTGCMRGPDPIDPPLDGGIGGTGSASLSSKMTNDHFSIVDPG